MDDDGQFTTHSVRELTEEESRRLNNDTTLVTSFKRHKLEKEAKKNWDLFYKRNTTKFFKDRHWTTREFQELTSKVFFGERLYNNIFGLELMNYYMLDNFQSDQICLKRCFHHHRHHCK